MPGGTAGTGGPTAGSSTVIPPVAGTGTTMPPPAAGPCDLSGRWLSTVHTVTDALGQKQVARSYVYYEITQTGDTFTVTRGTDCGDDVEGLGAFAATCDFRPAWPSIANKAGYTGRTGTSVADGAGCKVTFAKWYTVRGATIPHYLDPAVAMPTADEKASGDTPGWEDWDGDGNPGITGTISGVATGKIFTAPRVWTELTDSVTDVTQTFKLPVVWDQDANVMAVDGSPVLNSEAARASDPSLHWAQFARLTAEQGVGADNAALCANLVPLARTLTPEATEPGM